MKRFLLPFLIVFIHLLNTHGQVNYFGKIVYMPNPCMTDPCLPGMVFGLETEFGGYQYILTVNSHWVGSEDKLIVDDIEYFIDDEISITGKSSAKLDLNSVEYSVFEIGTIKKMFSNQDVQRFLGSYSLEGTCEELIMDLMFSNKCTVVITEGTESDLLFDINGYLSTPAFKAYVSNDSLVVPLQLREEFDWIQTFKGEGKIKNDSLFLYYGVCGTQGCIECEVKGKKTNLSNITSAPADQNKVYYNVAKQIIVIDETLQNQSSTFELTNLQGRVIFKQTNIRNTVSIANLPDGVYLYRLFLNNQEIYLGKILKVKK